MSLELPMSCLLFEFQEVVIVACYIIPVKASQLCLNTTNSLSESDFFKIIYLLKIEHLRAIDTARLNPS